MSCEFPKRSITTPILLAIPEPADAKGGAALSAMSAMCRSTSTYLTCNMIDAGSTFFFLKLWPLTSNWCYFFLPHPLKRQRAITTLISQGSASRQNLCFAGTWIPPSVHVLSWYAKSCTEPIRTRLFDNEDASSIAASVHLNFSTLFEIAQVATELSPASTKSLRN